MWPANQPVSAAYGANQDPNDPNNPEYWQNAAYMWSSGTTATYAVTPTEPAWSQGNGQQTTQWEGQAGYNQGNNSSYDSQTYYYEGTGDYNSQSQNYDSSQQSWQGDSYQGNKKANGYGAQKSSAPSVNYKNMTYCVQENNVKCRECSAMCDKDSFIQHVTDVHDALICCKFCSWRPTVRTSHVSFKDFMLKHYKYKHNVDREEIAQTHLDTQFDELVARLEGETDVKQAPIGPVKPVAPAKMVNKNVGNKKNVLVNKNVGPKKAGGPGKKGAAPTKPPADGKGKMCIL